MRTSVAQVALVLVFAACTSPSEPAARGVTLTPTATGYSSRAMISATLVNESDVGYTYGACHPTLERRVWRRWVFAAEDPGLCAGVLSLVPPHSSSTVTFQLPAAVMEGTYRLRLEMQTSTDRKTKVVLSREFVIVDPE